MGQHPIRCVSQIAWSADDHPQALERAAAWGVTGIEVAPSLLFHGYEDPFAPGTEAIRAARSMFDAFGLTTPSMQALLTGAAGAQMFGSPEERAALDARIHQCVALAGALGVPHLVFGSPKQRRTPEGMGTDEAHAIALDTVRAWDSWCQTEGVSIGLECNPPLYGGNFWTTHADLMGFVETARLPTIGMTLDLGATVLEGFDAANVLRRMGPKVRHVHWSAPSLVPPPTDADGLAALHLLNAHQTTASLEMAKAGEGFATLDTIFAALHSHTW